MAIDTKNSQPRSGLEAGMGRLHCGCFCHCVELPASPHPLWISEFPGFVKSVVLTGLFLREVEGNREDNQMWPQLWVPLIRGPLGLYSRRTLGWEEWAEGGRCNRQLIAQAWHFHPTVS